MHFLQNVNLVGTRAGFPGKIDCATSPNFTGIARSFSNSAAPAPTVKFHSAAVARSAGMGAARPARSARPLAVDFPRLAPGGQIGHALEAELVPAGLFEEHQARVGGGAREDLLGAEVHDLGQVPALGEHSRKGSPYGALKNLCGRMNQAARRG